MKNINIEVETGGCYDGKVWPLSFMVLSQNCYGGPRYRGSNILYQSENGTQGRVVGYQHNIDPQPHFLAIQSRENLTA